MIRSIASLARSQTPASLGDSNNTCESLALVLYITISVLAGPVDCLEINLRSHRSYETYGTHLPRITKGVALNTRLGIMDFLKSHMVEVFMSKTVSQTSTTSVYRSQLQLCVKLIRETALYGRPETDPISVFGFKRIKIWSIMGRLCRNGWSNILRQNHIKKDTEKKVGSTSGCLRVE